MEMHVEEIWMAHFRAIVEREARECGSLRGAYRSISAKLAKSEEYIYQLYQQKPKADGTPRAISLPFSRQLLLNHTAIRHGAADLCARRTRHKHPGKKHQKRSHRPMLQHMSDTTKTVETTANEKI